MFSAPWWNLCAIFFIFVCRVKLSSDSNILVTELVGLSESFEVDGWVIKVSGQSRDILFKTAICKEMPSRVVASRY